MPTTTIETHQAAIEHEYGGVRRPAVTTLAITCPVTGETDAARNVYVYDVDPYDGTPTYVDGICTGCGAWIVVNEEGTGEVMGD